MPSIDFETERKEFEEFYDNNVALFEDAKKSFVALIHALVAHSGNIAISKIEGRIKKRDECIKKFAQKYQFGLENSKQPYAIKDYIADLIGLRIVCLYEDDIERIGKILSSHFAVIEITDKSAQIEKTEDAFGYKGLHLDLNLGEARGKLPEYVAYAGFNFEVQIRTIIQDSWSVLDQKIKYKKSIPTNLKRRINTLAALFELADREFREIRNSTEEEILKSEQENDELTTESISDHEQAGSGHRKYTKLDAFGFLKIAKHFFKDYEFEPQKVDGFAQEIIILDPNISKGKFNFYMREHIAHVRKYQVHFEKSKNEKLSPFTIIRHCLYAGDHAKFASLLTVKAKEAYEAWGIEKPE